MSVPAIFKDIDLQSQFDKQGFVILPFLDDVGLQKLRGLYKELHSSEPIGGFVSGSAQKDFNYKKEASDKLVDLFKSRYELFFKDYQPFGASFLFKNSSENSEVGVHQDWSIVDERKYVALNIWIPLDDINRDNGPLMILPGSQFSKHPVLRAPTLHFFFRGREQLVIDKLVPHYITAGQAIVLNQSVIHYSPANTSGKLRRAVTAGIKTLDAPMEFYFKPDSEKNALEVYEMDEDFLIKFDDFEKDIFLKPKYGRFVKETTYHLPKYEDKELKKLMKRMKTNAGYKPKTNFFSKLFAKF